MDTWTNKYAKNLEVIHENFLYFKASTKDKISHINDLKAE